MSAVAHDLAARLCFPPIGVKNPLGKKLLELKKLAKTSRLGPEKKRGAWLVYENILHTFSIHSSCTNSPTTPSFMTKYEVAFTLEV